MTMNTPRTVFFIAAAFSTVAIAANAQSSRQCSVVLELGPDAVSSSVYSACTARLAVRKDGPIEKRVTTANIPPTPNTSGVSVNVDAHPDTSVASVDVSRGNGAGVSVGAFNGNDPLVDVGLGRDAEGSLVDVAVNDGGISVGLGGHDITLGGGGGGFGGGLLD